MKRLIKQKGQAAMEFLMTYGWAILVVVIALVALAYMGLFSPNLAPPEMVVVNPPFFGKGLIAENAPGTDGTVTLELTNPSGEDLTVTGIDANGCGSINDNILIKIQTTQTFTIPCDFNSLVALTSEGKLIKGTLNVKYRKPDSRIELKVDGYFSVRVRKGISPLLSVLFRGSTPANGATISGPLTITLNTFSISDEDRYAFVDLDNSLVGWWRMDDVGGGSCTGTPANAGCAQWNTDQPSCNSHSQCTWYGVAETCIGGNYNCAAFTDIDSCTSHDFTCTWDGMSCSSDSGACTDFASDYNLCSQFFDQECIFPNEVCDGTITCAAQSSYPLCASIPGCSLTGGNSNIKDLSIYENDGIFDSDAGPNLISQEGKFESSIALTSADRSNIGLGKMSQHPILAITKDITVSAWINFSSSPAPIISTGLVTNTAYYASISTGQINFRRSSIPNSLNFNDVVPAATLQPHEWHHIAITVKEINPSLNEVRYFLDGTQIKLSSYTSTASYLPSDDIYLGAFPYQGLYPDNLLDEVTLFNRALSAEEIKSLYDSRSNSFNQTFSLPSGQHTYTAYVVDKDGNLKKTTVRNVIIQ